MTWQAELVDIVRKDYETKKKRNPKYSLRSYSKKLGLSHGSLSDFLRGKNKWNLSTQRAAVLVDQLNLDPNLSNRLLVSMGEAPKNKRRALPENDYEVLTDWTYYPILFSFDLPPRYSRPEAIAQRLGVTIEKVRRVTEDLLSRGLLVKNEKGRLVCSKDYVDAGDGPPSEKVREHHRVNLELSQKALEKVPMEARDFSALTFVGSEKELSRLRKEIRRLHEKASTLMSGSSPCNKVYRLSVQLFPVEFNS